ncbi:hypothetical protein ABGB18_17015 [Nonomuraea sp. B12E4]|uniref:hypothetical protein n=1 Tax=Nonomuraea sp. B12E4 TaxID=3153564 RepID=UPI00325D2EF5
MRPTGPNPGTTAGPDPGARPGARSGGNVGARCGADTGAAAGAHTSVAGEDPAAVHGRSAVGEAGGIAERVRGCPGVAGLSGGPFGTVATYLPGARLSGVSVDERAVEISIVATLDRPLPETADEVRRAVADLVGERRVNVRIDDIVERS